MSPAACCPPRISRCIACHASRQCVGQCEKAFGMRFEFICTCVRMPSLACSMKRTRCLARQLGMAPHGKHGGPRARPHTRNERTHTHGMECACRCVRIARLVRAVRDFGSCSCCWKRILVNKGVERRRTGVSKHHPSHEKAAVAPLRLPSAAQTAAFHSKYRLEAAPHPFWTSRFYNFQILFSGSALLAARS